MEPSRNEARYAGLPYALAGLSAPFAYLPPQQNLWMVSGSGRLPSA
jgi:hypothetical protein